LTQLICEPPVRSSLSVVIILTTTSLKETGLFELTTGGYQKPQSREVDHSGWSSPMSQQQSLVALLPTEVIIVILQDLDVPTLLQCKQVSTDPFDLPRFLKLILLFFRSVDYLLPSSKAL